MSLWPAVAIGEVEDAEQIVSILQKLGCDARCDGGVLTLSEPLSTPLFEDLLTELPEERREGLEALFLKAHERLVPNARGVVLRRWLQGAVLEGRLDPLLRRADEAEPALVIEAFVRANHSPAFRLEFQRALSEVLTGLRGVTENPGDLWAVAYLVGQFAVRDAVPTLTLMLANGRYGRMIYSGVSIRTQLLRALSAIVTADHYPVVRRHLGDHESHGLVYATCLRLRPDRWLTDIATCLKAAGAVTHGSPLAFALRAAVAHALQSGVGALTELIEVVDRSIAIAEHESVYESLARILQYEMLRNGAHWGVRTGALKPPHHYTIHPSAARAEEIMLTRTEPVLETGRAMVSERMLGAIIAVKHEELEHSPPDFVSVRSAFKNIASRVNEESN